MTDKTTDTLRMSMRQIVDMTPAAPNLPAIPERRSVARPVLALAGGFAAVLLFVGVGAALLVQSDAPGEAGRDMGAGNAAGAAVAVADAPIVVVFFEAGPIEPPATLVQGLNARSEVMGMLVVDATEGEAEIRRGMIAAGLPEDEPMWDDGPGIPATVRLRVENDEDVVSLSKYAAVLEGVTHVDAYFGTLDFYPPWSFQGDTEVVEETVVTTTTALSVGLLTPHEHATLVTQCLLDAGLDVIQEGTGITFDNRVVDVAVFERAVEACDRSLVERGFDLPGEPFTAPRP